MAKGLSMSALIVAILIVLVFGIDLATSIPFKTPDTTMEIGFVIGGILLAVMSWFTYREQK